MRLDAFDVEGDSISNATERFSLRGAIGDAAGQARHCRDEYVIFIRLD